MKTPWQRLKDQLSERNTLLPLHVTTMAQKAAKWDAQGNKALEEQVFAGNIATLDKLAEQLLNDRVPHE